MTARKFQNVAIGLGIALVLGGCASVGPDYEKPGIELPASYSQGGVTWHRHSLQDLPRTRAWWKAFGDSQLNRLVERALAQNQQLAAAAARLKQARALSAATRSLYFPGVELGGNADRTRFRFRGPGGGTNTLNSFSIPVDLSYEVDVWGKVRRMVESASAEADAAQETLNAMRLSIAAEVVQTYWALRAVDADRAVLADTLALRRKALSLVAKQHGAGAISGLDHERAKSEVSSAEASRLKLDQSRAELVNALAVLTGSMPTGSAMDEMANLPSPPRVPGTVPSDLLLQRPDIRAAERKVAAANAEIGVATAAFYPAFKIDASTGFDSKTLSTLLNASSLVWSLGVNATMPITEFGRLRHLRKAKVAAYEAATADYRQSVLDAVRDVENALQASTILAQRERVQNESVASASKARDMAMKRYEAGLASFLDVIDAERTYLSVKQDANAIRGERLAVSVALAKAIGGGW